MAKTITATVLFVDVVGSSRLRRGQGESTAQQTLNTLKDLIRAQVDTHRGRVANTAGDGFLLAFTSARDAVNCAVAIQQCIAEQRHRERGSVPQARIGINVGEVIEEGDDLFGLAVDAAEHIQAKAKGGEILASELVRGVVGAAEDVQFRERGRFRLKNFPGRWRLYEVPWQSHETPRDLVMCALLVCDFSGTTSMFERLGDEEGMEVIRAYSAIVRASLEGHPVFWSKNAGDTFLAAFQSPGPALSCAISMQRAFAARDREHGGEPLRAHIALHVGEVIREADELFGRAINFVVRLSEVATEQQIVASSHFEELTELGDETQFRYQGERELTGIPGRQRIFEIPWR